MKVLETFPTFSIETVGEKNEVFNHNCFLDSSSSDKRAIMLKSSESKYKGELSYPWDNYFGIDISLFLKGKIVLDLGCFSGGRSVAWFERYKLQEIAGIDVKQVYIDAANQFANKHKIKADFKLGFGESLPFEDEVFEAILTFDVFEHVRDLQKTLKECFRVLKPGGRLFSVFPCYFNPIEHHLSLVTKVPFIHYFFSGKTLIKAYNEIIEERPYEETYWYKRQSSTLEPWERCNGINGTTLFQFKKMLKQMDWKIIHQSKKPIGSVGRNISKRALIRILSKLFLPLNYFPFLQEVFLHRITYILEKR
ncbi:MAG: class I SAM-dependent methyltransferase [candidate division WOR-3 bacterium]